MLPFKPITAYLGPSPKILGFGSYGKVLSSNDKYAVKRVKSQTEHGIPEWNSDVVLEIVSLLKVNSPLVVPIVDVVFEPKSTNIVMPRAKSNLLRVVETNLGTLDIPKIIAQLCIGLADIHSAGLLHLDIKPENVLVHGPDNDIWYSDLGLSRIHTCIVNAIGQYFTLFYQPPELILKAETVTQKSDIWALGVLIAELLIAMYTGEYERLFPEGTKFHTLSGIFRLLGHPKYEWRSYIRDLVEVEGDEEYIPMWTLSLESSDKVTIYSYLRRKGLSEAEIDLVMSMLKLDPNDRPTIYQVLQHRYFNISEVIKEPSCHDLLTIYAHFPENKWRNMELRRGTIVFLIETGIRHNSNLETAGVSIYLLDRLMALDIIFIDQRETKVVALAALIAAGYVYVGFIEVDEFIADENLADLKLVEGEIERWVIEIFKITNFDLAVTTSAHFMRLITLQEPELFEKSRDIWYHAILTEYYFNPPSQVATAILDLAIGVNNIESQELRRQLLILPDNYRYDPDE